jgi:hypothetical protein
MFKSFKKSELAIIALALEEEDEKWRVCQYAKVNMQEKKKMWIRNAWKSRTV